MVKATNNSGLREGIVQPIAAQVPVPDRPARLSSAEAPSQSEHFVQFYESDEFLLDSLSDYITEGLAAGDAAVVVATAAHLEGLEGRLRSRGLDPASAQASGRYTSWDAVDTLSRLLVDDLPDRERFAELIDAIPLPAPASGQRVRLFGEMVALIWARGNRAGAALLEDLWNELAQSLNVSLYCAYPIADFAGQAQAALLGDICAKHERVLPAESYSALPDPVERLRFIATLQQRARSLDEIKSHMAAIIESSDDAIVSKTLDGVILSWNAGAERIFGYKADEIVGKSIYLLIPPDRTSEEPVILEKLRRGERVDHYETVRLTKDGREVNISVTVSPIRDSSGRVVAASKIARDITERKQLEAEREQLLAREQELRAEAESANTMKDEFLALLSHELRTPLNAILGWVRMLRTGRFDKATTARAIETIERNAKSQAQLIADLLDVSRIITGKIRINLRPVEIGESVAAAADAVRPAADSKRILLQVALDQMVGPILGDPDRLQQIVWNLLSNAVKFTPRGGSVQVQLRRTESEVEVVVTDTGQGIDSAFLPFVFDRFRQQDSTLTRKQSGLGLGLAIVRHLTELHGGTVHAYSRGADAGATFTVRFPAFVSEPAPLHHLASEEISTDEDLNQPPSGSSVLGQLSVLVVDDHPDTREMLTLMLRQQGARVRATGSAAEAIECVRNDRPDVLVSDIEMPEEDGYSLIRKIRATEAENREQIIAIALTAHARIEDRLRALSAGYHSHVAKPIEPVELIAVIESLTRANKSAQNASRQLGSLPR